MSGYKLFESEYKFMEVVWKHAPVNSTRLVVLCREILGWKKSTTYTVLRKLCERGLLKNENATVNYLVEKEEIQMQESRELLEKSFEGSLPMFLTTFLKKESLSEQEAMELKRIIDESRKGKGE
ncbi:MAG TPA: BlaI/MecI/CopY family transcriptional regulator [Anaerovoracaceae bacterium]|nr:BlaI/MecI/CopY family transcriptional regulator [Anaerovoracaceae bacterium]